MSNSKKIKGILAVTAGILAGAQGPSAQHPGPARSRCLQQHRPVVQQQAHTRLQQFDEALRQGQASRPQLQRLALGQAERPLQRPCPQPVIHPLEWNN